MKHNVPIQSLIDHIKTAIDVDPWAKEMAEELLKKHEAETVELIQAESCRFGAELTGYCPSCKRPLKTPFNNYFCGNCGRPVQWR